MSTLEKMLKEKDNEENIKEDVIMIEREANVIERSPLPLPNEVSNGFYVKKNAKKTIYKGRKEIKNVLDGKRNKLMMVVGPCSIHNIEEGEEYAKYLKSLSDDVDDKILLIMRAYFEKPRTNLGWNGLVYDPDLDGTADIEKGLRISRKLLYEIADIGLPTATEFIGSDVSQYYGDLISYAAIGARTSESQSHRHMASGLSMPVGIKNGTCGNYEKAINGVLAAKNPHSYMGADSNGKISRIRTKGNPYAHIILRGGESGPNYDSEHIKKVLRLQEKKGIDKGVVIDASHSNSGKDYSKQPDIVYNVVEQKLNGNNKIAGVMVESNIKSGSQDFEYPCRDISKLKRGLSITDSCLGWKETKKMIEKVYSML